MAVPGKDDDRLNEIRTNRFKPSKSKLAQSSRNVQKRNKKSKTKPKSTQVVFSNEISTCLDFAESERTQEYSVRHHANSIWNATNKSYLIKTCDWEIKVNEHFRKKCKFRRKRCQLNKKSPHMTKYDEQRYTEYCLSLCSGSGGTDLTWWSQFDREKKTIQTKRRLKNVWFIISK